MSKKTTIEQLKYNPYLFFQSLQQNREIITKLGKQKYQGKNPLIVRLDPTDASDARLRVLYTIPIIACHIDHLHGNVGGRNFFHIHELQKRIGSERNLGLKVSTTSYARDPPKKEVELPPPSGPPRQQWADPSDEPLPTSKELYEM